MGWEVLLLVLSTLEDLVRSSSQQSVIEQHTAP